MRAIKVGYLVAAVVMVACGGRAQAAHAFSMTYDQKMTARGQVMASKVKVKDDRVRIESHVDNVDNVVIRTSRGTVMYMPSEGVAMPLSAPEMPKSAVESPEDYLGYLKQRNAHLLRTETVQGEPCDVYAFTDSANGGTTTTWVSKVKHFPIRLEMDRPDGLAVAELSNVVLGASVSDAEFELPAGVKMMDMGQIMQDMKGLDPKSLLKNRE